MKEVPSPNPPLSESERSASEKLSDAELREIDEAILSESSDRWLKIARVVGDVQRRLRNVFPELSYLFYSERLICLIEKGELEVQGNPIFIRFSEVRRPGG